MVGPRRRQGAARRVTWLGRWAAAFGAALYALAIAWAPPAAKAASPPPTRSELMEAVSDAVEAVSARRGFGVDPEVVAAMAADAAAFTGNFCGPYAEGPDPCQTLLYDRRGLEPLVEAYLAEVATGRSRITALAARMATRAGTELERAGWPSQTDNKTVVVRLPADVFEANISLQAATGRVNLGTRRRVLFVQANAGALIAAFPDGRRQTARLDGASGQSIVWRAASGAAPQAVGRIEAAQAVGRIEAAQAAYCERASAEAPSGALVPFGWGRARFPEADRIRHRVATASQAGVEIVVQDRTGACSDACLQGLGIAFAQAIAVWRSGCEACAKDALSVVKVGRHVWLDARAADRLRRLAANPSASWVADLSQSQPGEMIRRLTTPSSSIATGMMVGFDQVDADPRLVRALCALPGAGAGWVAHAKAFLCGAPAPPMPLRPRLALQQGTDCDGEQPAVACGKPGGGIQLALGGYRYTVGTPGGEVAIGAGGVQVDVRPVILHEVGHWFGVPHPDAVDAGYADIMSGLFAPGRTCVAGESLVMLNNAADDRWTYRAAGNQALRLQRRFAPTGRR